MSRSSQLHRVPIFLTLLVRILLVSTLVHYDANTVVRAEDPAIGRQWVRRAQRDDSQESRHDRHHDYSFNPFSPKTITEPKVSTPTTADNAGVEEKNAKLWSDSPHQTRERVFDFTAPLSTLGTEEEGGRHNPSIDEQNMENPKEEPQGGVKPPPTQGSSPPSISSAPSVSSRPSNSPTISHQPTLSHTPTTSMGPTLRPITSHQPSYSLQPSKSSSPSHSPTNSHGPTQSPAPSPLPTISYKPTNSNQPSTSHNPTATSIPTWTPTLSIQPTISYTPTTLNHPTTSNHPTASGKPTSLLTISSVPSESSAPISSVSPTLPVGPMIFPSFVPSFVPSFTPSSVPTASGTNVTTPPPVGANLPPEQGCKASSIGTFGVTGQSSVLVRYLYEMNLNPREVQLNQVLTQVVPEVEKAITDTLLPVLFQEACTSSSSNNSSRMLTQQRRLALVGLNSRPGDVISTDGDCKSISDPQNSTFCALVNGTFIMYSNETNANLTAFETDALDAISNAMVNGDYNDVHPAILNCTFRPVVEPRAATTKRRRGLNAFGKAMISLSAIAVVAGVAIFFLWDRRRRRRTQDYDKNNDASFSESENQQAEARNTDVESSNLVFANDQGRESDSDTPSYGRF